MQLKSFNLNLIQSSLLSASLLTVPMASMAAEYMPFMQGTTQVGASLQSAIESTQTSLKANGFDIVGSYSPSSNTQVIVVTNSALKSMAGLSENGGFGAMERIAVVQKGADVDISYTNPGYMWNVYRMKGDIQPIQSSMKTALGAQQEYGADEPISDKELREYHYKMMMPYFDDEDELAEFDSHESALKSVEAGLTAHMADSSKVYRIDIPGKKMSVFGVALKYKEASDQFISEAIDKKGMTHSAHFPYEILVVDGEVMALNGKFRIAVNWPHLSMMGEGSFMSIAGAPDNITEALKAVANNKKIEVESDF
jgi:hypothetical protein